jgi:large subunit ribosomal protein L25
MDSPTLTTQPRPAHGSRSARKLRAQGLIPAIVYGHKEATIAVALPQKDLQDALRHRARVVDLRLDGKTETAVIQEIQYDHLGIEVLHVDFKRVSRDERIAVTVRIELKGTPAGLGGGHILEQPLHELHIECPAHSIPESIRVNVTDLHPGHAIHVRELTLPPDVKAVSDPDLVVVQITTAKVEAEAPAVPAPGAAAAAAEPEIVGRRVKEEEGEE